ncbi:hypothetical protein [Methylopila sp. 73B]|uniref:hypothetical protein n=1 Tax=Methylopila sp. 73B TaxID=1120792 RepID=UPI000367276F|nr:hypothetical protein [Methylopila sp. 73B]
MDLADQIEAFLEGGAPFVLIEDIEMIEPIVELAQGEQIIGSVWRIRGALVQGGPRSTGCITVAGSADEVRDRLARFPLLLMLATGAEERRHGREIIGFGTFETAEALPEITTVRELVADAGFAPTKPVRTLQ